MDLIVMCHKYLKKLVRWTRLEEIYQESRFVDLNGSIKFFQWNWLFFAGVKGLPKIEIYGILRDFKFLGKTWDQSPMHQIF